MLPGGDKETLSQGRKEFELFEKIYQEGKIQEARQHLMKAFDHYGCEIPRNETVLDNVVLFIGLLYQIWRQVLHRIKFGLWIEKLALYTKVRIGSIILYYRSNKEKGILFVFCA